MGREMDRLIRQAVVENPWKHSAPPCPDCGTAFNRYMWMPSGPLQWFCAGCKRRYDPGAAKKPRKKKSPRKGAIYLCPPPYCPRIELHTGAPSGYLQWHEWAARMARTHKQIRCPGCDKLSIWTPKKPPQPEPAEVPAWASFVGGFTPLRVELPS